MFDLFLAECRRFQGWAIAYALAHLLLLLFLTRLMDLGQQSEEVYFAMGAALVLSGLLLGLYQMGSYRRPSAWLNLLHRPLAAWRIALALAGAAALLLAVAILLPLLATATWQDTMTPRVLDTRHWWLCLSAWVWALAGYLTGAAAILLPARAAPAAVVCVLLLPASYATGLAALLVQGLALAWLLALLLAAFRPDRESLPDGAAGALVALPMPVVFWLGLILAGFAVELAWIAQGSHPNNLANPPEGSVKQVEVAEGPELVIAGLAGSTHPSAALWREQAAISQITTLGLGIPYTAQWNELTNRAPMSFVDEERRIRWVFSHDEGRFLGFGTTHEQPVGTLGVAGQERFASPPLPGPDGLLVAHHELLQFDPESQRILSRIRFADDELIAGVKRSDERLIVLTQRALYLYDARPLRLREGPLETRQRVPLPGAVGNLQRIDVMALIDGDLVSFAFTRHHHNGRGPAFQQLVHAQESGQFDIVAERQLETGYGPLYTWQAWWLSPAISEGLGALRQAFAPFQPAYALAPPAKPALVTTLAAGLMLASLLAALLYLRSTALSRSARIGWCLACAAIGLPALLALVRLVPRKERPASAPRGVVARQAEAAS